MTLLEQFTSHLAEFELGPGRAIVAVSGGMDSLVLLDLLWRSQAEHRLELVLAHIDHGIHPESGDVARRVADLSARLELKCETVRLELGAGTTETTARELRYQWLHQIRETLGASWLFTAHHADDQAETVLMRLLRGSGPSGLAAMPDRDDTRVRPLLQFSRERLRSYAAERGIEAWEDPSNRDPTILRSWLRHEVLPLLRTRLPEVDRDLLRAGRQAALDRAAWEQLIELTPELDWQEEQVGGSLALEGLLAWDGPLALRLLSSLARRLGFVLGPSRAGRVLMMARTGVSGAVLELGGGWQAERAFDRLRIVHTLELPPQAELVIEGGVGSAIWGAEWVLDWRLEQAPEHQDRNGLSAWFIPETMTVRHWKVGERIQPLRGRGQRLLARCFQDARIPRSRRERWPVVSAGGRPLWVPGVCRSADLVPAPGQTALRVEARGR